MLLTVSVNLSIILSILKFILAALSVQDVLQSGGLIFAYYYILMAELLHDQKLLKANTADRAAWG